MIITFATLYLDQPNNYHKLRSRRVSINLSRFRKLNSQTWNYWETVNNWSKINDSKECFRSFVFEQTSSIIQYYVYTYFYELNVYFDENFISSRNDLSLFFQIRRINFQRWNRWKSYFPSTTFLIIIIKNSILGKIDILNVTSSSISTRT